jgi:hypothetical protein
MSFYVPSRLRSMLPSTRGREGSPCLVRMQPLMGTRVGGGEPAQARAVEPTQARKSAAAKRPGPEPSLSDAQVCGSDTQEHLEVDPAGRVGRPRYDDDAHDGLPPVGRGLEAVLARRRAGNLEAPSSVGPRVYQRPCAARGAKLDDDERPSRPLSTPTGYGAFHRSDAEWPVDFNDDVLGWWPGEPFHPTDCPLQRLLGSTVSRLRRCTTDDQHQSHPYQHDVLHGLSFFRTPDRTTAPQSSRAYRTVKAVARM